MTWPPSSPGWPPDTGSTKRFSPQAVLRKSPMPRITPDRVIAALRRDPELLFALTQQLYGIKILGPWENTTRTRWVRRNPSGKAVLQIDKQAHPTQTIWRALKPQGGFVGHLPTIEAAKALADELAVRQGWELAQPARQPLRIAKWVPSPSHPGGTARTLSGAILADVQAYGGATYRWSCRCGAYETSGSESCLEDALQKLGEPLRGEGWCLLPDTVTGLDSTFPPLPDAGEKPHHK